MAELLPSKSLIELLKVTSGIFLNISLAIPHFKKLTESDYSLIFSLLSKPQTWDSMEENDKIIYITRFDNGRILRSQHLVA